jgi:hypothetical protein
VSSADGLEALIVEPFNSFCGSRWRNEHPPCAFKPLILWRPRRDLNPCYRRESGMAKRNSNKLQGRGRTGWRSRSSKKHLIVSPMCPRTFALVALPFLASTKSFLKSGRRASSKVLLVMPAQLDGNQNRVHASLKSRRGPRGMSLAGAP